MVNHRIFLICVGVGLLLTAEMILGVEGHSIRGGALLSGMPLVVLIALFGRSMLVFSSVVFVFVFSYFSMRPLEQAKLKTIIFSLVIYLSSSWYFIFMWGFNSLVTPIYFGNVLAFSILLALVFWNKRWGIYKVFCLSMVLDLWFLSFAFPVGL